MRYVLVGFDSDDEAMKFLEHLHELPEMDRQLRVATPTEGGKVRIAKFGIRTAYLRDIRRVDDDIPLE